MNREDFISYLKRIKELDKPYSSTISNVESFWTKILSICPAAPDPICEPDESGIVTLTWNGPNYYLEVEFKTNSKLEWLYFNKKPSKMQEDATSYTGGDGTIDSIPEAFITHLNLIATSNIH